MQDKAEIIYKILDVHRVWSLGLSLQLYIVGGADNEWNVRMNSLYCHVRRPLSRYVFLSFSRSQVTEDQHVVRKGDALFAIEINIHDECPICVSVFRRRISHGGSISYSE